MLEMMKWFLDARNSYFSTFNTFTATEMRHKREKETNERWRNINISFLKAHIFQSTGSLTNYYRKNTGGRRRVEKSLELMSQRRDTMTTMTSRQPATKASRHTKTREENFPLRNRGIQFWNCGMCFLFLFAVVDFRAHDIYYLDASPCTLQINYLPTSLWLLSSDKVARESSRVGERAANCFAVHERNSIWFDRD